MSRTGYQYGGGGAAYGRATDPAAAGGGKRKTGGHGEPGGSGQYLREQPGRRGCPDGDFVEHFLPIKTSKIKKKDVDKRRWL